MTVRNLLEAIGEIVPDKQFVDKLLNVDRELSYLRPMLVRAPIADPPLWGSGLPRTSALVSMAMWAHARARLCCQARRGTNTGMLWHLLSQRK